MEAIKQNNRNAELVSASFKILTFVRIASRALAVPLLALVWVYQRTLSPDHGMLKPWFPHGYCRFHPSCSEYSRQILIKDGLLGLPKIIKRLIRCNPLTAPAVDLP